MGRGGRRRAVGDSGRAQRVIKTIRNRGYRWVIQIAAPPHTPSDAEELPPSASIPAAEQGLAVPLPGDGERKLVTVLTGALAHTEALTEGLDLETLLTVRRRFFTLAQQEVQHYEGTMQHFADDRFLAFFGTPVAHEDHAQRTVARTYAEQALSPSQHDGSSIEMGIDIGVDMHTHLAQCLWLLGYPDQARARIKEALVLARTQVHPGSQASALQYAAYIQVSCGAWSAVQVHTDALLTLATEQRLAWFGVCALHYRGQALVAQGDTAEGMAQMHRGMAAVQGASEILQTVFLRHPGRGVRTEWAGRGRPGAAG